jgi:hypothetical protein
VQLAQKEHYCVCNTYTQAAVAVCRGVCHKESAVVSTMIRASEYSVSK